MYSRITLTTDFAEASHTAFLHALALALRYKSTLDILHVRDPGEDVQLLEFPKVRATLQGWGVAGLPPVLDRNSSIGGMRINKVEVASSNAVESIASFARQHGSELLVAASHGRLGLKRLIRGSLTEALVRETGLPMLLIGPEAKPFVDPSTGEVSLTNVVFPLADQPAPDTAYDELVQFLNGSSADVLPLHVRQGPSRFDGGTYEGLKVQLASGEPARAIVCFGRDVGADLLVMATEGAHGLKDAVFGSTTMQVLNHAPCPVLVVPVQQAD